MTDPATMYASAAADLDTHLRDCPQCSTGRACPDGDDIAEREFRASRQLHRDAAGGGARW